MQDGIANIPVIGTYAKLTKCLFVGTFFLFLPSLPSFMNQLDRETGKDHISAKIMERVTSQGNPLVIFPGMWNISN